MNINSMIFLTAFLPAVFVLDRLCVRNIKAKNALLLLASLVFYAWGNPAHLLLLLLSIAVNYGLGILIDSRREEKKAARAALAAGIVINLGMLGYYKYFNALLGLLNDIGGRQIFEQKGISLPIGISIFTFGTISYLVDLYRGHYRAEKNPVNMALYVSFFPKISVGPIARYQDIGPQLRARTISGEKTIEGIRRFSYGLAKKVLLANILGTYIDKVYSLGFADVTGTMAWLAAVLYPLQIYYDFSGFADMAVGLGKMFGFDICENFDYPYLSGSIQEFWRRWHISLGSWFRDYLYIPLGGNRRGKMRTNLNLMIVFLATGLWHGAASGYIVWGVIQGVCLIIERAGFKRILEKTKVFKYIYTEIVVIFGEVIFRVGNFNYALRYLKRMVLPWRYTTSAYALQELMSNRCMVTALIALLGAGIIQVILKKCCPFAERLKGGTLDMLYCMCLVAASMLLLINGTYNPAIYLNF